MKSMLKTASLLSVVFSLVLFVVNASANDSAASTAEGGIKLTSEARISMKKERLTIGKDRVRVEYEFLNESDQDITTEVAFPIPEYKWEGDDQARDFTGFHLWVGGQEKRYQIEVKAMLGGVDHNDQLRELGIDAASFGHFDWHLFKSKDIQRLSARQRSEFASAGLIDADGIPQWSVRKTYHWTQVFPAKKTVQIVHEYAPVLGFMPVEASDLNPGQRRKGTEDWQVSAWHEIDQTCVDASLRKRMSAEVEGKRRKDTGGGDYLSMAWVDYILTTANSWKTPIKDFELIVERPTADGSGQHWYVSLCWDGPITRIDANHYSAQIKDFVPSKELRVAFLGI